MNFLIADVIQLAIGTMISQGGAAKIKSKTFSELAPGLLFWIHDICLAKHYIYSSETSSGILKTEKDIFILQSLSSFSCIQYIIFFSLGV